MSDPLRFNILDVELSLGVSPALWPNCRLADLATIVNVVGDKLRTTLLAQGACQVYREGLTFTASFSDPPVLGSDDVIPTLKSLFHEWNLSGIHLIRAQVDYGLVPNEALDSLLAHQATKGLSQELLAPASVRYHIKPDRARCFDDAGNEFRSLLVGGPEYAWFAHAYDYEAEPLLNGEAHFPHGHCSHVPVTLFITQDADQ